MNHTHLRVFEVYSFALFCALAPARAPADELAVVIAGKPQAPAEAYKAGGKLYLDAKRVGALYGGQVYWYPVSGRVQLTLRGRVLQFVAGSDKAVGDGEELRLREPMLVRVSRAFLPVSFLTGEDFTRWSGFETRHDETTSTLVVERRGTVGPPRVFSYKDFTRVSIELVPRASWRAAARGTGGAELVVDYGVAEGDEDADIDDGVVASYSLRQEARLSRLSVRFARKGLRWRAQELAGPRRATLEVYAASVGRSPMASGGGTSSQYGSVEFPKAAPAASPGAPAALEGPRGRRRLIVIDPGHGGKDPGAMGRRGSREKDLNLAAALELSRVLRERGDFDVTLTREEDRFVPLADRSELANSKAADLFVSLHCNASGRRDSGFEVYSVSETASDPEAERIAAAENAALEFEGKNPQDEHAKLILLAMTRTEMVNESAAFAALAARALTKRVEIEARGAKQAAFYVLRGTHAPAILVEMAFVTHPKDEALLASRRFRRRLAEGVSAGIADYARRQGWLE